MPRSGLLAPVAILLAAMMLAPSLLAAAPQRVASLGQCTDELVLMLGTPGQVASVSFLAHDSRETPLASKARGLHRNDGSFASVVTLKPDLVVTGGNVNRFAREMAAASGAAILDVPPPSDIAGLRSNIRTVAAALGVPHRGEALIDWMDGKLGAPAPSVPAIMLAPGGLTPMPGGLTATLLGHAGIDSIGTGARMSLETLASRTAIPLIVGNYRAGEFSRPQDFVAVATRGRALFVTDSRLWTCPSPLVAADVARLRRTVAR